MATIDNKENSGMVSRRGLLTAAGACALPLVAGAMPLGGLLSSAAHAAAPHLGLRKPDWARFKLGAFEFTTLADSDIFIDGPFPLIGGNATADEVAKLMGDNLLPPNKYQPGFTPTLLNTGKELVLFDAGNGGNGFVSRPNGGWMANNLAAAGYKPEQIDVVVLTHGHSDHVGGLLENGKPAFPNARYVMSATEYDFWAPAGKHSGDAETMAAVFRSNVVPLAERISFIKPGDDVVAGVRAIEAYGHTPGHLAFHIESNGNRLLLWGDCAHHQVASLARPDWHCVFDADREQAAATRKRVFDMAATEKIAVAGYHMPFPSVGYVERDPAGGYRWLAHTYQLNTP